VAYPLYHSRSRNVVGNSYHMVLQLHSFGDLAIIIESIQASRILLLVRRLKLDWCCWRTIPCS
jgi:hypothetical protein